MFKTVLSKIKPKLKLCLYLVLCIGMAPRDCYDSVQPPSVSQEMAVAVVVRYKVQHCNWLHYPSLLYSTAHSEATCKTTIHKNSNQSGKLKIWLIYCWTTTTVYIGTIFKLYHYFQLEVHRINYLPLLSITPGQYNIEFRISQMSPKAPNNIIGAALFISIG